MTVPAGQIMFMGQGWLSVAEAAETQRGMRMDEVERLKRELSMAQENNHARNVELDALHYVWCDGGCEGGIHRFGEHPPLTAEIVAAAIRNAERLRRWYVNRRGRQEAECGASRDIAWNTSYREIIDALKDTAK